MVYSAPKEIKAPSYELDDYEKDINRYVKEVKKLCMAHGKGPHRGKIYKESVADGYAYYMIYSLSPVNLIHLEVYDAYQAPRADRITAKEIKMCLEFESKYGTPDFDI